MNLAGGGDALYAYHGTDEDTVCPVHVNVPEVLHVGVHQAFATIPRQHGCDSEQSERRL